MPVSFAPSATDYLRFLPEIVMIVDGNADHGDGAAAGLEQTECLQFLTLLGFIAALAAAVVANDYPGTSFSNMLIVDGFATFFRVLVIGVGIFTVLSSSDYLRREHAASAEYYALLLFSISGQCIMATANELIMIFIGLEISSIATYILAGYLRDDKRNNEAALEIFPAGFFRDRVPVVRHRLDLRDHRIHQSGATSGIF